MTAPGSTRPLVVAAHGTASAAGRAVVEECAGRAGELLGVPASVGYVDVCEPVLADVLRGTAHPVVVPLFLATGYHVRHDVPAALEQSRGGVVTEAIGTASALIEALLARLRELVEPRGSITDHLDALVLASAGSSLPGARAEVAEVARLLAERARVPVTVAYLSGPGPGIDEVCAAHHALGRSRLAVVSHLLAPGVFLDRARHLGEQSGVVGVTDALGTHPAISTLVAGRYTRALAPLAPAPDTPIGMR